MTSDAQRFLAGVVLYDLATEGSSPARAWLDESGMAVVDHAVARLRGHDLDRRRALLALAGLQVAAHASGWMTSAEIVDLVTRSPGPNPVAVVASALARRLADATLWADQLAVP